MATQKKFGVTIETINIEIPLEYQKDIERYIDAVGKIHESTINSKKLICK